MKNVFLPALFCCISFLSFAQSDKVALAEAALAKNDFTGAYDLANAALQSPQSLDKNAIAKASYIRGKAGVKMAYDAMLDGDEIAEKKYVDVPLQSYRDFQKVINAGDETMKAMVTAEYNKLGNALLVAGTKYDGRFNDNTETADSSLLDKAIENFSGSIEIFELTKKEKFKPYLFRGDVFFTKKKFNEATADYTKAFALFEGAPRDNPDFNIGDLGYRLAYMQAAVFNKKDVALQTLEKTRKLLDAEMQLAESKKDKLGERYAECKTEYEYFKSELAELDAKLKK
ncbi:MAG: hypothetical protein SH857_17190 [Chitinophagales bacterium]|nr:hypothetical protein [Chitinophagales bacterium]